MAFPPLWLHGLPVYPDVACGNASSNTSSGGRLVTFEVPENTTVKISQDATASLILLWKVTAGGFNQCSLIDGRSVTLLQAAGGLVFPEEMLALGNNYFIGFVNDSVSKCIVALRLVVVVKVTDCIPEGRSPEAPHCFGKGECVTKKKETSFNAPHDPVCLGSRCLALPAPDVTVSQNSQQRKFTDRHIGTPK
ncbi:unnamed protein product [Ranitomeya imitator]|uniref:Uncharacterized protein n=1 Tax=Ranitomeya imitator TaxID=111125 RepID=A0ABN9MLQ7_9NEOB|nr:unnamed protein product [Ranitomeya imitator]